MTNMCQMISSIRSTCLISTWHEGGIAVLRTSNDLSDLVARRTNSDPTAWGDCAPKSLQSDAGVCGYIVYCPSAACCVTWSGVGNVA